MRFDGTTGCNPNRLSSARSLCQPWRVVLAGGSLVLAISFLIAGALRAASSAILWTDRRRTVRRPRSFQLFHSEGPLQ